MAKGDSWCDVCCTRHVRREDCPGNLLATGPERHARKFMSSDKHRVEYYGVLIAEAGEVWRARIFTFPNMLWTVPGGRGTIKFVGASAQEAERRAVEFLREHSSSRGHRLVDATDAVPAGRVRSEQADVLDPHGGREERHPCKVAIRFGEEKATRTATTANLSVGGIYIATDHPLPKGRRVRMRLELAQYTIPLAGTVAWVRTRAEPGKPVGMGVQLHHPPSLYARYVIAVKEQIEEQAAAAGPTDALPS
jgi:uncharacterized protein (TIGR02266 family)